MFRKRLCLALIIVLGYVGSQASGAFLAAYWDENYATHWSDLDITIEIRDYFEAAGYEILDADQLKAWMDDRIADGAASVIIFCPDLAPETVIETNTADCTLRKYLDAGGKIVFHGDIPFYNQGNPGGGETNWGDGGAVGILGFNAAGGAWDTGNTVTITPEGQEWGLTETWASLRPASPTDVDIILAADNAGNPAAWVKHYVEGDTTRGFVRLFDRNDSPGDQPNLDDMRRVAEFGLGPNPLARGPKPRNGSMTTQAVVMLEWVSGDYASVHDVYFGESFEEVEAATPEDPNVFLGTLSTEMLRVGSAGDLYPEPLVPGQTYYWRVDEVNDLDPDSPWKGDVWSFWVQPVIAYNPSPADGAPHVLLDPQLTWEGGMGVLFHTVFFGESYEEVDNMMVGWMIADPTVAPAEAQLYGPLQPETTYYWRVDEFAMPGTTNKGEVWSFTTIPEITITDPDLVSWWTLQEGTGSTAVDWSGHGNHGSLRGDPQWVDGSLIFDGRNDYVSVLLDVSETEYAAAFWFRTTDGNCGLMAVVQNDLGGGGHDRHVYLTGGNIKIRLWDTEEIETTELSLADGLWHHVVYTYGAAVGGQQLYVDGVLEASGTKDASDFDWQERINVGFSNDAAQDYFEGALEDVRIYGKTLSEAEVQQVMRGNPLLAWTPQPPRDATVDIRDATALRWVAGDTAVSHDVYFGTNRAAVAAADNSAPEFQGNQPGTSASLAGLVEFGGGDYFWRIDEVEAAGTVQTGNTWKFTVPDYLVVEDFESYSNEVGFRAFETWIDGIGFTLPEPGSPGNGTGSAVGHDIWSVDSPYYEGTIMETANVYAGGQAMPIYYDNTFAPFRSEVDHTFVPAENWTVEGVTTLVVHFRGAADNTGDLYVKINGVKIPYDGDPADIATRTWMAWEIDLASAGVPVTNVTTLTIGIEGGQTGVLYVDEILLTRP